MPHITISNSKKILRQLDVTKFDSIEEGIYKWDIYFFNKKENANLKGLREFLRDPTKFTLKYYHPIEVVDSYKYIYPESQPSYHKDNTCIRLKSNFRNAEIPVAIQQKGKEEVIQFRDWYKKTQFKDNDTKDFIYKLQIRFPYVGEINPKTIDYANSGTIEKKNYSLTELEKEIDLLLRAAADYFKSNTELQPIIKRYQKLTFLGYVYGDLFSNDSGLNDDELKKILRNYHEKFKAPVRDLLENITECSSILT